MGIFNKSLYNQNVIEDNNLFLLQSFADEFEILRPMLIKAGAIGIGEFGM